MAQKLWQLGVVQQDVLLSELRKLIELGFIYPMTESKWVSLMVVITNKNGKGHVCVDYKPLNAMTKSDHFPLLFQDEILNEVIGYDCYEKKQETHTSYGKLTHKNTRHRGG